MPRAQLPDNERVRSVFEEVLSSSDFHEPTVSVAERMIRLVLDALDTLFGRWLPALGDGEVRLLSWLLVLATAVTVVLVVHARSRSARPKGRGGPRGPAQTKPRDAAGWVRWARSEQVAGRLREASTGLYQAVVLHLESRGAVRYGEWKTPGDYAIEITGDEAAGSFESFLALFVEVAFGPREPTPEAVDHLFTSAGRLGCPT